MDAKKAVESAKTYLLDLFQQERLQDVGLEEVEFDQDSNEWAVTIGFSRPWDNPVNKILLAPLEKVRHRDYKVVRVNNTSGEIKSVKNREVPA